MKRWWWVLPLVWGVAAAAQEAAPAAAEPGLQISQRRGRYTIEADGATVGQIMKRLEELSGSRIELDPELEQKPVQLSLRQVPLDRLMTALAQNYMIEYLRKPDGSYQMVSATLSDRYQEQIGDRRLGLGQRRALVRNKEQIEKVQQEIAALYGYAGVLAGDDARALILRRREQFDALVDQMAGLGPGGARALAESYAQAGSTRAHQAVIQALGRIQDPDAPLTLGTLFEKEEIFSLKEQILSALFRREDAAAFRVMESLLERERDTSLRARAVAMAAGRPELAALFMRMVQSPEENVDVRREAIRALGAIGGPEARGVIENAASRAENALIQNAARAELQRLDRQATAPAPAGP